MSPSKSFNIAGLFTSIAIIPNKELREMYEDSLQAMEINHVHIFGALGLEAAYSKGEAWLDQMLEYVEENIDYAVDYIESNIPEIKLVKPEATYLLWLDFRSLNKTADEIRDALLKTGEIILNDGRPYGQGGEGYFRLNVGCPRPTLEEGLKKIGKAVEALK